MDSYHTINDYYHNILKVRVISKFLSIEDFDSFISNHVCRRP